MIQTFSRKLSKPAIKRQLGNIGPLIRGKTFEEHFAIEQPYFNPFHNPEVNRHIYYEWAPKDTDVISCVHPKAGTTWLCATLHQLTTRGKSIDRYLDDEIGMLGPRLTPSGEPSSVSNGHNPEEDPEFGHGFERKVYFNNLSWPTTPKRGNAKYVSLVRDGRDVCVSSFFFWNKLTPEVRKAVPAFTSDWNETVDNFLDGTKLYHGDWFLHVYDWMYASRTDPRVFQVTYENMKQDLIGTLKQIAAHLEITDISDEKFNEIAERLEMKSFKQQASKVDHRHLNLYTDKKSESNFLRKGVSGDYKNYWTEEQNERYLKKLHDVFGNDHPWIDL